MTFVNDLYTGSISDKGITRESLILSLLEEGGEVMADEAFLIKHLPSEIKVSLVIPLFLGTSRHLNPEEVMQAQARAKFHIHVEEDQEYHIFNCLTHDTSGLF